MIEDRDFYEKMVKVFNLFGDGKVGEKIVKILVGLYEKGELKVKSFCFI